MDFPYGETVTRLRADTTEDDYHNEIEDWSNPSTLSIDGAAVALGGTFDVNLTDRQSTEADFDIILPIGSDVVATDHLEIRGEECDIVGRPFEWRSPFTGWEPGMVVRASVREG